MFVVNRQQLFAVVKLALFEHHCSLDFKPLIGKEKMFGGKSPGRYKKRQLLTCKKEELDFEHGTRFLSKSRLSDCFLDNL